MSKKTDAITDFKSAAKSVVGISHGTIENKMNGMERFAELLYEKGFQVHGVESIGTRHIQTFVAAKMEVINRHKDDLDQRKYNGMVGSLHNEMSHIRTCLAAKGREDFAKHPGISNQGLGIPARDRTGTNKACTPEQFQKLISAVEKKDPGVAATLRLERAFGLRGKEGIEAWKSLPSWDKALVKGAEKVDVIYGTKGGRPRETQILDRAEALSAVKNAIAVAKTQQGGKLIEKPTLVQAKDRYHYVMRNREVTGHSLRYAYARDDKAKYRETGKYSEKEINSLVASDLGHGTGRTELVTNVYCQESSSE